MKIINYIPCKTTSIRVPKKNIKIYDSHRLIDYTYNFSNLTNNTTLISSDDKELLNSFDENNLVKHHRQGHLTSNSLSNIDVMRFIFKESEYCDYDYILLLQATHPFRKLIDYKNIIKFINSTKLKYPLVSIDNKNQHKTITNRNKTSIEGSYYLFPKSFFSKKNIHSTYDFIGFHLQNELHVNIDEKKDELAFLTQLESKQNILDMGYELP
tara:strand:- start:1217 stop:1852 length:636 start_codon:yes stop_codon:yes gene_type:complete